MHTDESILVVEAPDTPVDAADLEQATKLADQYRKRIDGLVGKLLNGMSDDEISAMIVERLRKMSPDKVRAILESYSDGLSSAPQWTRHGIRCSTSYTPKKAGSATFVFSAIILDSAYRDVRIWVEDEPDYKWIVNLKTGKQTYSDPIIRKPLKVAVRKKAVAWAKDVQVFAI